MPCTHITSLSRPHITVCRSCLVRRRARMVAASLGLSCFRVPRICGVLLLAPSSAPRWRTTYGTCYGIETSALFSVFPLVLTRKERWCPNCSYLSYESCLTLLLSISLTCRHQEWKQDHLSPYATQAYPDHAQSGPAPVAREDEDQSWGAQQHGRFAAPS